VNKNVICYNLSKGVWEDNNPQMNLDFDKIIYFLKAAEKLNFSQAAKELFISSQALTKQITALEHELGEKLFVRTTRSIKLTDFGKVLRNQMMPVKSMYDEAQYEVMNYLNQSEKKLKIVFFTAVSKQYTLLPIVNELMVKLPDVRIEMEAVEMDDTIDDIRQGKADLAITQLIEFEKCDDLECIKLITMPASIIVSLYHPWMTKTSITKEDMASMPILLYSRRREESSDSFFHHVQASAYHFSSNYNAMLATLELGKDYAVFPKMFEHINQFHFQYFDLPEEYRFNCSVVLLYRKDSRFRTFFETLKTSVQEGIIKEDKF